MSETSCSAGDISKSRDSDKSSSSAKSESKELHDEEDTITNETVNENENDDTKVLSSLKRSNSVKERANLFEKREGEQNIEELEKTLQNPKSGKLHIKPCTESTLYTMFNA